MPTPYGLAVLALLIAAPALAQPADTLEVDSAFDDLADLLGEEVETAATYSQKASQAAASVSVVTSDEIERAGYRTVAEALGQVRGFTLSDDRNYVYAGVRGLSRPSDYNNRIAILVDGVPVRDGLSGSAPIGYSLGVPMAAIERIEVVRGPGSALYGAGAMFAVVNVITKDVRTLEGAYGVVGTGQYGSLHGEAVAAASLPGGVTASVAAYGLDSDGPDLYFPELDAPETADGRASGLDWERVRGGFATVQAGASQVTLRYGERDKGIPTGAFETAFPLEAWTRDRRASATLRTEAELSPRVTVSGLAGLNHYYYFGEYPYDDGDGPYDSFDDSFSTAVDARARVQWDPSPAHRVVAGADLTREVQSRYRLYDESEIYLDAESPFTSAGLYAQTESQLAPTLAVTVGARADRVRGDAAVSPRGAVVYAPDDRTTLKLVAGTAFRAPSAYELTYEDVFTGQVANPRLSPERVATAEAIVIREVGPGLRVEAAAFATNVADLIDTVEDPETQALRLDNVGRAQTRGVEVVAAAVVAGWRSRASVGLQRATDPDLGEALTNAPAHVAKASAFGPLGGGVWLSAGVQAESGRRTVYGTTTDAYAVVDAALSADVLGDHGRVTLGVRNALDADYALPGGFEHVQLAIPQRPRSAYVRLDVRL